MVLPGMSDGRMFTIYTTNCQMNKDIMKALNINSENEYREVLQSDEISKKLNNLEKKIDNKKK